MLLNDIQVPATGIVLILITALKLLLIPSYKSTDFDVHRNWLAITHHIPLSQWYYNDVDGTTVHTLDYPPSFAFFEYFLSNNYITQSLIKHRYLDDRCFALLPDDDNEVGLDCVIFHRCTVIFADVVFLLGAWALGQALHHKNEDKYDHADKKRRWCTLLVVTNSGLILLDHIHFQYNGMMLGILLASLACLTQSMKITSSSSTTATCRAQRIILELLGAIFFALLLTFKHLYLTLAPMYFFYLLRRFCFRDITGTGTCSEDTGGKKKALLGGVGGAGSNVEEPNNSTNATRGKGRVIFSFSRLVLLGSTVLVTVCMPFSLFLTEGKDQMVQMLSRLFPFQRGLCHDYWAGNIWAMYLFAEKVCSFASRIHPTLDNIIPSPFPKITPAMTAILLLIGLLPAMQCAYLAASSSSLNPAARQEVILYCTVYSSITSFMLAYHVHEKAIMTAVIPMTYLAFRSREGARLFLRMSALGHFGLMPLLFRPTELLLKALLNSSYFVLCVFILEMVHNSKEHADEQDSSSTRNGLLLRLDKISLVVMTSVSIYIEILHEAIFGSEKFEFIPLMLTSLCCAVGLFGCWIQCGITMYRTTKQSS